METFVIRQDDVRFDQKLLDAKETSSTELKPDAVDKYTTFGKGVAKLPSHLNNLALDGDNGSSSSKDYSIP